VDNNDARVDLYDVEHKQMTVTLDTAKMKDGVYTVKYRSFSVQD